MPLLWGGGELRQVSALRTLCLLYPLAPSTQKGSHSESLLLYADVMADTPSSSDDQTQSQEKYWKPKKRTGEARGDYQKRYYTAQRTYANEIDDNTTSAKIDSKLKPSQRRGDVPNKAQTDSYQIDATMAAVPAGKAAGMAKGLF